MIILSFRTGTRAELIVPDVHRLGRTARAGEKGHGILILGTFESHFPASKEMRHLPLQPYPPISPSSLSTSRSIISEALAKVPDEAKAQAYQAWIGYYNSSLKTLGWNQNDLVRYANEYAGNLGYVGEGSGKPPGLMAKTVGKMGLKGVQGLNVVREIPGAVGSGRGGGGGGGGRGGRGGRGGSNTFASGSGGGGGGGRGGLVGESGAGLPRHMNGQDRAPKREREGGETLTRGSGGRGRGSGGGRGMGRGGGRGGGIGDS